jgi:hypothetical protein
MVRLMIIASLLKRKTMSDKKEEENSVNLLPFSTKNITYPISYYLNVLHPNVEKSS